MFDDQGMPTVVEAVQEYTPEVCYRVEFKDGVSLTGDGKATLGLQSYVYRKKLGAYRARPIKPYRKRFRMQLTTLTLSELEKRPLHTVYGRLDWAMPIPAVQYPWRDLPVPPYVFGVWWAGGAKAKLYKGARDMQKIQARFRQHGYEIVDRVPYKRYFEIRPSIQHSFLFAGAELPSRIPFAYCQGSAEQRQEFLDGLIDGLAIKPTSNDQQWAHYSNDWHEVRRIQALVESLGYRTTLQNGKNLALRYKVRSQQHRLVTKIERVPAEKCVFVQTKTKILVGEGFIPVC